MDPLNVRSRHQSLHHFVAHANWSDERMLLGICQWVVPLMDFSDGGWWIIDDTGFPKQGRHSVGVARQYCGMLGKQDNCQVAVSVSLASAAASIPVAWQLYLPQNGRTTRPTRKASVPEALGSSTSLRSLRQIQHLLAQGRRGTAC
jgi:SRSO17 transposase